jgi:hypothetical protein
MAPEQREHPDAVDNRADIYALGVVFYQMLTGELPGKHLEPPSSKVQIDVRLDEVVLRALEKKPELRYQQISVFKTQVETITQTPVAGSDASFTDQHHKAPWSPLLILMSIGLTILCVGLAFRFFVRGSGMEVVMGVAMLAITFGCALFTIRGYTITRNALLVHRLLWNTRLSLDGLKSARFELGAMRWGIRCGNGGFFSFTGLFYNRKLGFHRAFVTDHIRTVVLRYPHRTVVVSPADPEAFVRDLAKLTEQAKPETRNAQDETAPCFSPTAVIGALLIPVFFFSTVFWNFGHWGGLQALVGTIMSTLGFVSIVAATILGWVAVGQIRRSGGRLCGMWLALFDGLMLPGLVLNVALIFGLLLVNKFINVWLLSWWYPVLAEHAFLNNPHFLIWLLFAVTAVIGSNYVIVRGIWRAANRSANGSARIAGPGWKTPFAASAILATVFVVAALVAFHFHPERPFYIGQKSFPQGDYIEITSVERSTNQMVVKGDYNLVSHDQALLALYCTSTNRNVHEEAIQRMQISKGRGDFELSRSHLYPGLHHVTMYSLGAVGKPFAGVYFGNQEEAREESKLDLGYYGEQAHGDRRSQSATTTDTILTTSLPIGPGSPRIDPVTGLPVAPAGTSSTTIDPTTGLPIQGGSSPVKVTLARQGLVISSLPDGLRQVSVTFSNHDRVASPAFSVLFYAGPSPGNGRLISRNKAGPIPAAGTFSEGSANFILRDNETEVCAVIDPENVLQLQRTARSRVPCQSARSLIRRMCCSGLLNPSNGF